MLIKSYNIQKCLNLIIHFKRKNDCKERYNIFMEILEDSYKEQMINKGLI